MDRDVTHITVTLPKALLAAIDAAVQAGAVRSRNAFVIEAVCQALVAIENAEIDAAFAAMAVEDAYQCEARQIAAEFESASWEALQLHTP